eukprot:TRINITY_DN2342_c0_g1_i1.p1 TRINITY_DN2342_c0_g1~~TRINITY_DN2342_c0_g1_i1.p1  ORF type:complete len:192 (-),score=38.61 TRINITY_DN2342_c0_g1_i1:326-901(-)
MAKRELSNTLKSLKFMQRTIQKEEKTKKEEEVKSDGNFLSSTNNHNRRCIVIMEGNPHPGAIKGRMSFQSFNPSIDKLTEEAANLHQSPVSTTSSSDQSARNTDRESETSQIRLGGLNIARTDDCSDLDHKRKQPEIVNGKQSLYKSPRNASGESDGESSQNNRQSSHKQQKRKNLNWRVLRPPKAQTKRS